LLAVGKKRQKNMEKKIKKMMKLYPKASLVDTIREPLLPLETESTLVDPSSSSFYDNDEKIVVAYPVVNEINDDDIVVAFPANFDSATRFIPCYSCHHFILDLLSDSLNI
jgi:hypothetical protein